MNIGSTIKKLRREKDLTQENLAEFLGVSVSAVSQWEAGKTAPDLSMIPPLCSMFSVSADVLLGINLEAKEKKIEAIINEAHAYSSRGYREKAQKILTEGLSEFPDSFEIMYHLMYNCHSGADDSNLDKTERDKMRDEAIRIAELILEKCTDDHIRHSAIQILCYIYPTIDKLDRALELADKMPHMVISNEFLRAHIHSYDEGVQSAILLIDNLIQFLSNNISGMAYCKHDNGEFVYNMEERAALRDKQIAFLSLMYEDGNMGFYHCHASGAHRKQAYYYAKKQDAQNAVAHLEKAAEHAVRFVRFAADKDYKRTSLLFREQNNSNFSFTTGSTRNDALMLLNDTASHDFDFIRDTEEFRRIVESLKVHADNWTPAFTE